MKKLSAIFIIAFLVLGITAFPAWAMPAAQADVPSFDVQVSPQNPYPGQQVVVTVQVTNYEQSKDSLGKVTIQVQGITDNENKEPSGDLNFDAQGKATFTFFTSSESGTYPIQVILKYGPESTPTPGKNFTLVVETALPLPVAQVFAGLGLFVAVMAIMAVGAEVVIELIKSLLGFKSKTSAMEALDQLKSEIPGAIAGLGIDAARMKELENLIEGLKTAIRPIANSTDIVVKAIYEGDFGEAYRLFVELGKTQASDEALKNLQGNVKQAFEDGFTSLYKKIPAAKKYVDPLRIEIIDMIGKANMGDVPALLDKFKKLQDGIAKNTAAISAEWLRSQMDTYLQTGRKGVDGMENDLLGALKGIGFPDDQIKLLRGGLDGKIDDIESLARDKVSVYSLTVKSLLQALEDRRNLIQSPLRKLWRSLRDSKLRAWAIYLLTFIIIILPFGYGVIFRVLQAKSMCWVVPFVWAGIVLAIAGISFWVVWLSPWRTQYTQFKNIRLGYFMRYGVERCFNWIIGHDHTVEAAKLYGEIDARFQKQIDAVKPTTLAGSLLSLETMHQDQETSRVRLIRFLSIIIGTILAYELRIDASAYLDIAIPGIQAKINIVNFHHFLPTIPEGLTVGILLTGFAASAGSKFWRDLLARLQETRGQAEEVAQLAKKVKGMIPSEEK